MKQNFTFRLALAFTLVTTFIFSAHAQHIVTTLAGTGAAGFAGDGDSAKKSVLNFPFFVVTDANNNIFFTDLNNNRVRKIDNKTGKISTIAGNGIAGYTGDGGPGYQEGLNGPNGIAVDRGGNVYIADVFNHRIRKVNAKTGFMTTFAGTGTGGFFGDSGLATKAKLRSPSSVFFDTSGNLLICDNGNSRIRKVDSVTGIITTIAGDGFQAFGGDGDSATHASFNNPLTGITDRQGNIYINDAENHRIRKINASDGRIHTYAGNGVAIYGGDGGKATDASMLSVFQLAIDTKGNLLIADFADNRIRSVDVTTDTITTIVGNGSDTLTPDGADALQTSIGSPYGVCVNKTGNILVTDSKNNLLREIKTGLLPLKLISFSAARQGNANLLTWQAYEETNVIYYGVERAHNGQHFAAIGSVTAIKNGAGINHYSFTDENIADGTTYYRLKMADKNGKYTYSKTISMNNAFVSLSASLYPNPVVDKVSLRFAIANMQKLTLSVIGLDGKVALHMPFTANTGLSTTMLNVNSLSAGTYIIQVTANGQPVCLPLKFVKQ